MINDFSERKYPQINRCIYCGNTENLSDEHIIPYGLGGKTVLVKASCSVCARITGRVEQILRGAMWPVRSYLGIQSRRPKDFPVTEKYYIEKSGLNKEIEIPIKDSSIILPMPNFKLPAYITGKDFIQGIDLIGADFISFGKRPEELAKEHSIKSMSVNKNLKGVEFARLLAKIAFCFVVAECGLDNIDGSPIVSSILGESNDIGMWVGTLEREGNIINNVLHRMELNEGPANSYLAKIQLFASSGAPTYGVIIKKTR